MLLSVVVLAFEPGSILVSLDASSVRYTLIPLPFIGHASALCELALAVLLSSRKFTFVYISTRARLSASALRYTFVPLTIVFLTVTHCHLTLSMPLSILELSLVHITIL